MVKRRIALLSNITADMIAAKLRKQYDVYLPDGYDMWISDVLNTESGFYNASCEAVILLLDGTEFRSFHTVEEAEARLALWQNAVLALIQNVTDVPVFLSTVDFRETAIRTFAERVNYTKWQDEWYQFVQSEAEKATNVFVLDILKQIMDDGRKQVYSNKMWYMGSMPYSKTGIQTVTNEIQLALDAVFGSRKKIIVLDLDNTLWGGVVGEDGVNGIALSEHKEGARYYDFQMRLSEMQQRGVLLALNSKNNPEDALEAIRQHPQMLLRENSFVLEKINWNDKASNIKEMESELNLTEGSFVFIDDNPVEQEVVGGACPDVIIPEFPLDSSNLIDFAEDIYRHYFKSLYLTDEDKTKTQMYQTESKRKSLQRSALNLDDYIRVLEMQADIHQMRSDEAERVQQLCNKTNQFNFTTKRYSLKEITDLALSDETDIFTVSSCDKFGDNGLVGVVICKKAVHEVDIDTFLMSCRVMGRKLENVLISCLAQYYGKTAEFLTGTYIPTKKNTPVLNKYDELGFVLIDELDGVKRYKLSLREAYPDVDCYSAVRFQGGKT